MVSDNPHGFLMKESWPVYNPELAYAEEVKKRESAMEVIKSIRNIRAEVEAAPSKKLRAVILAEERIWKRLRLENDILRALQILLKYFLPQTKGRSLRKLCQQ